MPESYFKRTLSLKSQVSVIPRPYGCIYMTGGSLNGINEFVANRGKLQIAKVEVDVMSGDIELAPTAQLEDECILTVQGRDSDGQRIWVTVPGIKVSSADAAAEYLQGLITSGSIVTRSGYRLKNDGNIQFSHQIQTYSPNPSQPAE